jgi:heme/copper-type cytochrome/quinol oxidase subunit 1
MDRFVKNFIIMSIVYLAISTVFGIVMIGSEKLMTLKFVHSHLMLIGWVSFMIYGVGYHILPRFTGRMLKHPAIAEAQFWIANLGLLGMVGFYTLNVYDPASLYRTLTVASGLLEALSIFMFFYNMLVTIGPKIEEPQH